MFSAGETFLNLLYLADKTPLIVKKIHLLFLLSCFLPGLYSQTIVNPSASRVALVIGNGDYLAGPLKNTVNDARSMARALRSTGFEVLLKENLSNKDEMKRAIREFGAKLEPGGTALLFYSGHGIQVNGFNYLIPVNALINIQEEVEYECVDVGFVLAYMENAGTDVNIVILDACRNNPFARTFRDASQGLIGMTAPTGTILAFSTAPGSVASDGDGVNGLYTQELLKQINTPGQKVEDVFKNVRRNVVQYSNGAQTPWESSSLIGDFYFSGPVQGPGNAELSQVDSGTENTVSGHQELKDKPGQRVENTQQVPAIPPAKSAEKVSFKWRATPDGTYFLLVNDKDISSETINELRGENLYVYHESSGHLFILKSFIYRMDGAWRKGVSE